MADVVEKATDTIRSFLPNRREEMVPDPKSLFSGLPSLIMAFGAGIYVLRLHETASNFCRSTADGDANEGLRLFADPNIKTKKKKKKGLYRAPIGSAKLRESLKPALFTSLGQGSYGSQTLRPSLSSKTLLEKTYVSKSLPNKTSVSMLQRALSSESPPARNRLVQIPTAKNPIVKIPTAKNPIVKIPTAKNPIVKIPAAESPLVQIPPARNRLVRIPTAKNPIVKIPAAESPLVQIPPTRNRLVRVVRIPTAKNPIVKIPTAQNPIVKIPCCSQSSCPDPCSGWPDLDSCQPFGPDPFCCDIDFTRLALLGFPFVIVPIYKIIFGCRKSEPRWPWHGFSLFNFFPQHWTLSQMLTFGVLCWVILKTCLWVICKAFFAKETYPRKIQSFASQYGYALPMQAALLYYMSPNNRSSGSCSSPSEYMKQRLGLLQQI